MKIQELNKSKLPIVRVDRSLEPLAEKVLFPEKLENANEVLAAAGLPATQRTAKLPVKSSRPAGLRQNRV